ncbi:MAG: amidohydrolase family protein, partial [Alphaproteobacteria bacterium]
AAFPDVPVHIHVAEQVKEVEDCLAAHGTRPIALLADHVALDARWCLIHATHADAAERKAMLDAGLVAGLCPVTEANLGDGLFDAVDFMGKGGAVAVGTDSNVAISVTGELALLEYGQRLKTLRRAALAPRGGSTGRRLFDATLAGGAQALGLRSHGLTVGAQADFVVLDTDDIAFAGRSDDAILDTWLFGPATRAVKEVYCGGKRVVADGRHILRETVEARARQVLERIATS